MTELKWYFVRDGQKVGPFATEEMTKLAITGVLASNSTVLREDWQDGKPFGAVVEFRQERLPAPPSVPNTIYVSGVPSKSKFGEYVRATLAWLGTLLLFLVGSAYGMLAGITIISLVAGSAILLVGHLTKNSVDQGHETGKPFLPVSVSFRNSAVGKGMVMKITNHSKGGNLSGLGFTIRGTGTNPGKISRELKVPLEPGKSIDIGWRELDGWELSPGESIEISAKGNYGTFKTIVPSKAVDN